jgi:uncharacterized protein YidB (DUF937 family)
MGLLDQLAGQVLGSLAGGQPDVQGGSERLGGGAQAALLQAVIGLIQNSEGGLGGLLGKLSQGGLGQEVASWVSPGANLPVSADQLGAALGSDTLDGLHNRLGLTGDQLAGLLPQVVDRLTPEGQVPSSEAVLNQGLAALGALLGGRA